MTNAIHMWVAGLILLNMVQACCILFLLRQLADLSRATGPENPKE